MKKKVIQMGKLFFSGFCDQCSEVYEAQSRTDNLSGIKFKCKSTTCLGDVILQEGRTSSLAAHYHRRAIEDPRFC